MKQCKDCLVIKPRSEFYNNKTSRDGHFYDCKSCHNEKVKRYRLENKKEQYKFIETIKQEKVDIMGANIIDPLLRLYQIIGNPNSNPPIQPVIPISRATWWRGVKDGQFPSPVKLGTRAIFWRQSDILKLLNAQTFTKEKQVPRLEQLEKEYANAQLVVKAAGKDVQAAQDAFSTACDAASTTWVALQKAREEKAK